MLHVFCYFLYHVIYAYGSEINLKVKKVKAKGGMFGVWSVTVQS